MIDADVISNNTVRGNNFRLTGASPMATLPGKSLALHDYDIILSYM